MNDIIALFKCCTQSETLQNEASFQGTIAPTINLNNKTSNNNSIISNSIISNSIQSNNDITTSGIDNSSYLLQLNNESHEPVINSPKFNQKEDSSDHQEGQNSSSQPLIPKESNKNSNLTLVTFSNFQLKETTSQRESLLSSKLLINGELFWNKNIIIDHYGMQNGLRKKQDGQAYFGLTNSKDYTGTYLNDLVLNFSFTKTTSNNSTGRVFDISFQKKTNDFQLYMIHNSLVLNYHIENYFYFDFDRDYYMMLGKVFMTFSARKRDKVKQIDIQVEIENEPTKNYIFSENDIPVSIGRVNSSINIKSNCISKAHSLIELSKSCNQFYYKDLGSTNGSILIIKEDDTLKLKGAMKFKLEEIPFHILEIP